MGARLMLVDKSGTVFETMEFDGSDADEFDIDAIIEGVGFAHDLFLHDLSMMFQRYRKANPKEETVEA